MAAVEAHESALFARLLGGLAELDHVTLYGKAARRAPTAFFSVAGVTPRAVAEELAARLAELDRLAPQAGEAAALAEERALLGAAEKTLAEISQARDLLDGEGLAGRLGQALRALERARSRLDGLGAGPASVAAGRIAAACEALDRTLIEAGEAAVAVDAAAEAFDLDPFAILAWRGRGRDELLGALRLTGREDDEPARPLIDVTDRPLAECIADFWSPGMSVQRLRALPPVPAAPPDLLLRTFEPPQLQVRNNDLITLLGPAYHRLAVPDEPADG